MTQYIDKAALVAKIENLIGKAYDSSSYCNGWQHSLRMLELSLNTLEVKEIQEEPAANDLEEAASLYHRDIIDNAEDYTIDSVFKAGVKWQKEKTIKWLTALNNEHEIMSYTDSHNLETDELISYYKDYMED